MRSVVLLLLGVHLVNAATHSLQYFYTATTGVTNFPRFVDVGMLDGEAISMYDSTSQRKIPKQKWMAENFDQQYWDKNIEMLKSTEQVFLNNIQVVMSRFNQTPGIHTWQQMYGCSWDETNGDVDGFDDFGYDGEDFVSLDLKNLRYVSTGREAFITQVKWNNDKAYLESKKQYRSQTCIEWLKKYLQYGKSTLQKEVSPQVSLLQRDSSSPVTCHATGFFPEQVAISWLKNGQEHDEDVDLGVPLPNEDGTFQKMSTLTVTPDEWKKNQYSCVVEHKGKTIRKILSENEIRTNTENSVPIAIIVGAVAAVFLLAAISVVAYLIYQKKKGENIHLIYVTISTLQYISQVVCCSDCCLRLILIMFCLLVKLLNLQSTSLVVF